MTTIVFCSSIEYVTITISIIIRHNKIEEPGVHKSTSGGN